ncbi:hypothetical protein [Fimbriimonas ginsengisoli]|nr:hypothetical protein [Fimbriimonas ginsengisoli]
MKLTHLLPLCALAGLAGCSSRDSASGMHPTENVTSRQKIDQIKADPNVPDGLKQIQVDTLSKDPMARK